MTEKRTENVIIIGGACAGYTAAVYAARADLEPLVIEGFQWGGQLQNTTEVENYPGFPEGIMGPELMNRFRAQAERFGTRFITDDATRVELTDGGIQTVWVGDDAYRARSVILAMGAQPKRLGIPGELELAGRGVSTCGVCDGAFFKGRDVVVIGGGDTAMEDSIFVAKYADELTVLHRRDEFRASMVMQDRARAADNIQFKTPYIPEEFVAGDDGALDHVRIRHADTGEVERDEGRRRVRRDRPHPRLRAGRRAGRPPRQRLRQGLRALDADEPRRGLRDRRPRRLHIPPGGHGGRVRHARRPRRRVVPTRHPAERRGEDRGSRGGAGRELTS